MFDIDFATAPVTFNLLILNTLISGYALLAQPSLIERWGFRPYDVIHHKAWYRFITAGFLHGGFWHFLFNMYTLYIFGPYIEAYYLGSVGFAILYFGSMIVAHGFTLYTHRNNYNYNAIGASGAISGVLLSFCMFNPFAQLYIFGILPLWAWLFAILFIGYSVYASKHPQPGMMGSIAHEAHLGGAIGGIIITLILVPEAFTILLNQLSF